MPAKDEMVAHYREMYPAMTERERAEAEVDIWNAVPIEEKEQFAGNTTVRRQQILSTLLGVSTLELINRLRLYNVGPPAEPLWERVQKDYTLSTAVKIVRDASQQSGEKSEAAWLAAVRECMREYDSRPQQRFLGNGKIARAGTTNRRAIAEVIKPVARQKPSNPDAQRVFWDELRDRVAAFLGPKLAGAPEIVREQLWREFEFDLKVLLEGFQAKIYRVSKAEKAGGFTAVYRKQVLEACQTLNVEPPKPGKPADLTTARKMQRKLASLYHPDRHSGDTTMSGLYQKVMEAYPTLEQYNSALGKRGDE